MANRNCPTDFDELAERYCLGLLPDPEIAAFEEHYLSCADCAAELERMEAYVSAMRAAVRRSAQSSRTVSAAGN